MIDFKYHKSTNIYSTEYNLKTQELIIEFMRGHRYKYYNISKDLYKEMLESESIGKFHKVFLAKQHGEEKL